MEQTIAEIAPSLVQLESETAREIVRQVMIYKYVELGLTTLVVLAIMGVVAYATHRAFSL